MSIEKDIENLTTGGEHSPAEWIRAVFTLQAEGFTGCLSLLHGRNARHFLVLDGHFADFWSTYNDEALSRTLPKAKLVDAKAVLDQSDQQTELTVLSDGLLKEAQLEAHQIERLKEGLQAGILQQAGRWQAVEHPSLKSVEVSRALYPSIDLWNVMWDGVCEHMETGQLLAWAGKERRQFRRSPQVALPFLEEANAELIGKSNDAMSLANFLASAERPEQVPARLWVLAAAGILDVVEVEPEKLEAPIKSSVTAPVVDTKPVPSQAPDAVSVSKPDTPATPKPQQQAPSPPPVSPASPRMSRTPLPTAPRPTGNQVEDLVNEHRQRMNKDYYAFLGLTPDAPPEELREVSRKLAQRFNALSRTPTLPEEIRLKVRDMLSGVQRVYGTFTDRKRKEEYDNLLAAGEAPIVELRNAVPPMDMPQSGSDGRTAAKDGDADARWGFFKKGGPR